ncbi:hypothetical protein P3L10_019647 [Capsicum annuum]
MHLVCVQMLSSIYSVNINTQVLENLKELTGYTTGALPFKYLGVPISAKKLTSMDCEVLLDKMTSRIKTWGTRNLSYAGRVQLVNSVLMHIHTYWSFIFLLPKNVLKGITAVCRNFIWGGAVHINKPPLVAWDVVCKAKKEGGLSIIDSIVWNEAAIAKYVWNVACKADNLWVKWVDHVYIKGLNWWQ